MHAKQTKQTIDVINVFYVFLFRSRFSRFLTFFLIFFHVLYLKKTLSNAKYKYVKNPTKIFLEDDLAMIFLLILVCYVAYTGKYLTYLLKSTEVIQIWEFDNLHIRCAKIIVGFIANVGNVFYPTFTNAFSFSPRF